MGRFTRHFIGIILLLGGSSGFAQFEILPNLPYNIRSIDCHEGICILAGYYDLFLTMDAGNNLDTIQSPRNFYNQGHRKVAMIDNDEYYVSTVVGWDPYWEFKISHTSNQGQNWDTVFQNGGYGSIYPFIVSEFEMISANRSLIYGSNALITTDDYFESFDTIDNGISTQIVSSHGSLAVYAYVSALYVSTDSGDTWKEHQIPDSKHLLQCTARANGEIIATDADNLYFSKDTGQTWQTTAIDIPGIEFRTEFLFQNDSVGYALANFNGYKSFLFRTYDNGNKWDTIRIPVNEAFTMAFVNDSIALIGSHDFKVVRLNINKLPELKYDTTTSVLSLNHGVNELDLYPNPTNSILHITLPIESSDHYLIELFDAQGTLIESRQIKSNDGQFDHDVSELSNGIYFYRIQTPPGAYQARFVKQ